MPVRLDGPLVGRDDIMRRLEDACQLAASARATRLVTVIGEAGIGKTRTVHELSARLGERVTVVTGRCLPYGEGITFWPLRDLVRAATGGEDTPHAIEVLMRGEPDAVTVAGRLGAAFGSGQPGTADAAEIFWATRRLLEVLSRPRPLLVVLEDLHTGLNRRSWTCWSRWRCSTRGARSSCCASPVPSCWNVARPGERPPGARS